MKLRSNTHDCELTRKNSLIFHKKSLQKIKKNKKNPAITLDSRDINEIFTQSLGSIIKIFIQNLLFYFRYIGLDSFQQGSRTGCQLFNLKIVHKKLTIFHIYLYG